MQDNHSRSRRGTLRGIHFQTHPGQGKLVRCARGRVLDVVVDLRRGSPTFGEWESVELDDVHGRQLWIPVGFGHGFCVLSEEADFVYKCTAYYDGATEAGIRFDDPDVGVEWPQDIELLYSERDRTAPRLSEVADELPFVYGRDAGRPLRPQPDRDAARRQPAHGAARVAVRALAGRALPRAHGGPRSGPRALGVGDRAARGPARDRARLGRRGALPVRAPRRPTRPRSSGCAAEGRVYECFCTRAEIRAAASAPHGPLPEGAYPGTCLRLTDGERRRKRAGGRPPALRLRADAARIGFEDRLLGRYEAVVDDFVVRRNDGAAAYNLAVMVDDAAQGIGEVVRGADLLDSTPRQLLVARLARACPSRRGRTCRSCSGRTARGWPSATGR